MKNILICISLVLIGLFSGYLIFDSSDEKVTEKRDGVLLAEVELKKLKEIERKYQEKMKKMTSIDIEDYVSLKNQKEKYLKADELLGKVMLIFLADLGLHLNKNINDWANSNQEEKRREFDEVFANQKDPKSKQKEIEEIDQDFMSEVRPEVDDLQFQKEQAYNSKRSLQGHLGFKDKLGASLNSRMDYTVSKELWSKKPWEKATHPLSGDQLEFYKVKTRGLFRRGRKTQAKIFFKLQMPSKTQVGKPVKPVRLEISVKNSKRFYFHYKDKVEAVHPVSHNRFGRGICRGVILKGKNGVVVYLSYLKPSNGNKDPDRIVGRLLDTRLKNPFLGNFLLNVNK
ncbi:MAG: hypothetical protein KC493_16425 [Bacteriovoracaceae bacterium]|nr:hypothetical protein [Bacteriovoracaceae bacterium]